MASSTSSPHIDADTTHQLSTHTDRPTDPTLGSLETRTGVRGAGTGTGTGTGSGGSHPGTRRSTVSHHSVHIVLPEEDDDEEEEDHSESRSISSRSSYSTCSSSAGSAHVCSRKSEDGDDDDGHVGGGVSPSARQLFWTYVGLTPVLLSILALFAGLLQLLPAAENGIVLHWDRFGVGMVGWFIAFGFRTPIFALFSKIFHLDDLLCEWCTLLSAAALEETLRLVLITLLEIRQDFGALYWMGLGRATTPGTGLAATGAQDQNGATKALGPTQIDSVNNNSNSNTNSNNGNNNDGDDNVEDLVPTPVARHLLGIDRPWWSLMGRTSSMMVHIGLGCWLGHAGAALLLPAALVHGALYVIWGIFLPDQWSVPATSYGTFMAAMAIFLIGLALYGQIV
ncbi:hypothetical protein BGZ70_007566 [Mortierella alpina]|uniref:Uncharacterized protein n=1 Tax=Mortierella alpina TaxID=64518 RepID=A0A9P6J5F5_MORAP|nr:hypothetical protein BGZ70_007566 [Mortierella alpina]